MVGAVGAASPVAEAATGRALVEAGDGAFIDLKCTLLPMARHPFLSDEWIAAARAIRAEHDHVGPEVPDDIRMNQVVIDVPFGTGRVEAHIDTTSGTLEMELGHLENADVTVTLDYETAKAVFVDGTPQAAMKAFMDGKVRVQGEMAKLIATMGQVAAPDEASVTAVQQAIRDITE